VRRGKSHSQETGRGKRNETGRLPHKGKPGVDQTLRRNAQKKGRLQANESQKGGLAGVKRTAKHEKWVTKSGKGTRRRKTF